MGKKIDRFILRLLGTGALYFYFQGAVKHRLLAIGLALLSSIVLGRLLRKLILCLSRAGFIQKRRLRRDARGKMMNLACMEADAAAAGVDALVHKAYRGDYTVALIQAHPSATLAIDRLFDCWRAHRNTEKLVICVSCRCDASTRNMAASLTGPRVALIDSEALSQLIALHPECLSFSEKPQRRGHGRMAAFGQMLINRKNAPKNLLFSGASIIMYLLGGNVLYLAAGVFLLFLALISLRRPPRPANLF